MTFSKFKSETFNKKIILLFDIDGTLLHTGGIGQKSIEESFEELYGVKINIKRGTFAGKTDHIIYTELTKKYGLKPELGKFKKIYFKRLEKKLAEKKNLKPLPGIHEFCSTLVENEKFFLSLLTGNWRRGALLKIKYFGLKKFFNTGIFGDGISDRNILGKIAKDTFKNSKKIVIIGDTPSDIMCANSNGLISIAVATGPFDIEELRKYNPHLLLENFKNQEKILKFLREM